MTYTWTVIAIIAIGLIALLCIIGNKTNNDDIEDFSFVVAVILFCFTLLLVLVLAACWVTRSVQANQCEALELKGKKETKFITYNEFTWECLENTRDDIWVTVNNNNEKEED